MTRTRKLILGLLVAILCLALVATAYLTFSGNVLASADDIVTDDVDTNHSWEHDTDSSDEVMELDGNGGTLGVDSSKENPARYYLNGNITLQNNITVVGYVELCLNGYMLKGTGEGSVITVNEEASFTLYDCCEGVKCETEQHRHYYKVGDDGLFVFSDTFEAEQPCWAVFGGVITGGNSETGCGLLVEGEFTMYGGKVIGNDVGVYVNGTFNISGVVNISGNKVSNVYIVSGKLINVTSELEKDEAKSEIGITLASSDGNGAFANVSENVSENVAKYFSADIDGKCIGLHDGKLVLATHENKWVGSLEQHYWGCSNCGKIEGEVTPHDWSDMSYVSDGDLTHHQECPVCNFVRREAHVITKITRRDGSTHTGDCDICGAESVTMPHNWKVEVTKEPTETETGLKTKTCTVCGQSISETIPATGTVEPANPKDYQDIVFFWLLVILAIILLIDVIVLIVQLAKLSRKHSEEIEEAEEKRKGGNQ